MAERIERERLKARKARLIKQSEMYRRDLRADVGDLREVSAWMERGYAFYQAARRIRKWTSPFVALHSKKKQSSTMKVLAGCAAGFKIWRKLRSL
jgi:hypothetical protein